MANKKNGNWSKDKFTKMVQEYGDKIAGISERVEKELKEILENEKEVKLCQEYSDKKKLNKSVVSNEVLNSKSTFQPIFAYDLGLTTISGTDDLSELDVGMMEAETEDEEDFSTDPENDFFDIDELTKHELDSVKKIAGPFFNKLMKQTGKNLAYFALDLFTNGPGLMQYNIFDGVENLIKSHFSEKTVDRIYKIYERDTRFRKAYTIVLNNMSTKKERIHAHLLKLAKNAEKIDIDPKSVNTKDLELFRAIVTIITILGNKFYFPIIKSEIISNVEDGASVIAQLEIFIKSVMEISRKFDDNNKRIAETARNYINVVQKNERIKPVSVLLFVVSHIIALGTISDKYSDISRRNDNNSTTNKYNKLIENITFNEKQFVDMKSLNDKYFVTLNTPILTLNLGDKMVNFNYNSFISKIINMKKNSDVNNLLNEIDTEFKHKDIFDKYTPQANLEKFQYIVDKLLLENIPEFKNIISLID